MLFGRSRGRDRSRPAGRLGLLPALDPSVLAAGATSLPFGWRVIRASTATVQTGTSTLVRGIAADTPRVGKILDAWPNAILVEPARTNVNPVSAPAGIAGEWQSVGGTPTFTTGQTDPSGGTGALRVQLASGVSFYQQTAALADGGASSLSLWARSGAPGTLLYHDAGGGNLGGPASSAVPTTYQRIELSRTPGASQTVAAVAVDGRDLSAYGGLTAGARDSVIWGVQCELAAYPTSLIETTGTTATRAGDRYVNDFPARFLSSGRLRLWLQWYALASRTEHGSGNGHVWNLGNLNVFYSPSLSNKLVASVGGDLYTAATAPSAWSRYDLNDLWLEVGNGIPNIKFRRNGGSTETLSTGSPSAQAAINPTTIVTAFASSAGTLQLAAFVTRIEPFQPGSTPAWAV